MIIENSEIGYSRNRELVFSFITGVAGFPIGSWGCDPRHCRSPLARSNIVIGSKSSFVVVRKSSTLMRVTRIRGFALLTIALLCAITPAMACVLSRCDNDSCGARMLPPHGGAMRKFHDAGQSFLLQGSRTNKYCSAPGAGCRTGSSPHDCRDTSSRLVRDVDCGDVKFPSFVSSCPTSRTISRL